MFLYVFLLGCFTKESRGCPGGNMFILMEIWFCVCGYNLDDLLKKLPLYESFECQSVYIIVATVCHEIMATMWNRCLLLADLDLCK